MNRVQQGLPRFMSLISIAQGETFHISFVKSDNKGYGIDFRHQDPDRFRTDMLAQDFS